MTKTVASLLFAGSLVAWALLMASVGVVPWSALPFLGAVALAVLAIIALFVWATSVRAVLVALVVALPGSSWAQSVTDLGTGLNGAEVAFVTKLGDEVWFAIVNREWWMLASVIVTGLTWAWRMQLVDRFWKDSAFDRFCDHPVVAAVTPGALATLGGLLAGFAGTGPFSWAVLGESILKVWAGSVAGYVLMKKVGEARAPAEVQPPTTTASGG